MIRSIRHIKAVDDQDLPCLNKVRKRAQTFAMHQYSLTEAPSTDSLEAIITSVKGRLRSTTIPKGTTLEALDALVDELAAFGFGRHLLKHRATHGRWTQYMVLYPDLFAKSGQDPFGKPQTNFERTMLTRLPSILATQERFKIFQSKTQSLLKDRVTIASIPCGLMDNLLRLNFTQAPNARLIGIDIDSQSIELAHKNAAELGHADKVQFIESSAWSTPLESACDLITSNGLTIYESNDQKIVELYQHFFKALKPGGTLITSFLTPPPMVNTASPWDMSLVDPDMLSLQRLIFVEVLNAHWQHYRLEEDVHVYLEQAGFANITFHYDRAKIFPTACAQKP